MTKKQSGGGDRSRPPQGADFATGKPVNLLAPEERVRQVFERVLHLDLGYPKEAMDIEVPVQMGASVKRADIAVYDSARKGRIVGIVETKSPKAREGRRQLESYMSAVSTCRWGAWTNGREADYAAKNTTDGGISFDPSFSIPRCGEEFASIKSVDDLRPAHNLKFVFRQINNLLYANADLARTEKQGAEMMRLIFCKICDEYENRTPHFQARMGEDLPQLRERMNALLRKTAEGWLANDILLPAERLEIDNRSLAMIVRQLQGYALTRTDRDVVGDAFEVFSERQFAGEKGQFFTPRPVVKMAVEMLDPAPNEKIMDPACGSGGFLIHALSHVWRRLGGDAPGEMRSGIARTCFFGIDKEIDLVRICKAHMCLMGDGRSNIVRADSLKPPDAWDRAAKSVLLDEHDRPRQYDVILTNPPFGSKLKIRDGETLSRYDLGRGWTRRGGAWEMSGQTREVPPQVLFIELCLQMLRPGGRMAIVLPDGVLGNEGDGHVRQFIRDNAEIFAVVDCPQATFMPHTGTKTSLLLLRKFDKGERGARRPMFFAIAEKCGHTPRGRALYRDEERRELDEDFSEIAANYRAGKDGGGKGFRRAELSGGILVPRYYDPRVAGKIDALRGEKGADFRTIGELEGAGALQVSGVGPCPKSEECDSDGEIRYIRTADLGSFELRGDTKQKVDESVFEKYRAAQDLRVGDILFVKDGDKRIGDSVILFEDDLRILAQGHFYKIRALEGGPDPFLLFCLLNADIVKRQVRQRVFSQATLSTIGARIRELALPIPRSESRRRKIAAEVRALLESRRRALAELRALG